MRRSLALLLIGCAASAAWACGRTGIPALDELEERHIPTPVIHFPDGTPTATATPPDPMDDEGDGSDGDLLVLNGQNFEPTECRQVLGTTSGALVVADGAGLAAGVRLLVMQVQDGAFTSGSTAPVDAGSASDAGRWQVVEVQALAAGPGGSHATVHPAPKIGYASGGPTERRAQACTLPQFDTVTIAPGGVVRAEPWDGTTGGVVGFFSRGTTTHTGTISAAGRGFRGGEPRADADEQTVIVNDTDALAVAGSGGGKGEGIDGTSFARSGKGNLANAGGGGNGRNAGGGGGGNGGPGGLGGRQDSDVMASAAEDDMTRGLGGVAVSSPIAERMVFGGGGGAGQQNNGNAGEGGDGGGIVFLVLDTIQGNGAITVDGDPGSGSTGTRDGAGGGGAGGAVFVRARNDATGGGAWAVRAYGGGGGDVANDGTRFFGPGGGGGGGRVSVSPATGAFVVFALAGASGVIGAGTYGASAGSPGVIE